MPGGCTSGFNHVVKDDFPTRLLQLKGKQVYDVMYTNVCQCLSLIP